MVVLSVDVRQFFAESVQVSQRHDLIVDAADIFTGCGNLSRDDVLGIFIFCDHLDDGFFRAGADIGSVCTAAQCQADGFHGNGFSGAGFTGDGVETVVKVDFCFFYRCKVFNTDVSDHSVTTSLTGEQPAVSIFSAYC